MLQSLIWAEAPAHQSKKRKHRVKKQFRHGERRAVLQAIVGARLLLGLPVKPATRAEAAAMVGVNVPYLNFALTLFQAEDPMLVDAALHGYTSLRAAAAEARGRSKLINAYRKSSHFDHSKAGKTIGVSEIWDEMIVPSL